MLPVFSSNRAFPSECGAREAGEEPIRVPFRVPPSPSCLPLRFLALHALPPTRLDAHEPHKGDIHPHIENRGYTHTHVQTHIAVSRQVFSLTRNSLFSSLIYHCPRRALAPSPARADNASPRCGVLVVHLLCTQTLAHVFLARSAICVVHLRGGLLQLEQG